MKRGRIVAPVTVVIAWSTQAVNAKPKGAAMPPDNDADLNAGGGDAGDKSKDLNKDKQGDDEVVPKRQMIAALGSAERKTEAERARADALQVQLNEALAGKKKVDQPKQYTRAELGAAVTAGQITQEAADDLWDNQLLARADAIADQRSTENVTRAQRKERVDSDISRYVALEPDVLVDGSDARAKVAKEYQFLVSMGDPKTPDTELKAMRAALGPIDQLELAKSGRSQHESHRETGGGGGGGKPRGGKKFEDTLSAKERAHYQRGIDAGRYPKGWDDVKDELSHANPNTRRKNGATV